MLIGIDLGDAQRVADDGVGGRAAALAQNRFDFGVARAHCTISCTVRKKCSYFSSLMSASSFSMSARTLSGTPSGQRSLQSCLGQVAQMLEWLSCPRGTSSRG